MMRKQNSTFKTAFLSEAGSGLENHDYFAFVELEEYACYVLADGLNDLPDAESARLATQTIILVFQEHPSIKKRAISSYLEKANRTLAGANSREHLKASVTLLVTNYEYARYGYAGNTRLRLYRDGLVRKETMDKSQETEADNSTEAENRTKFVYPTKSGNSAESVYPLEAGQAGIVEGAGIGSVQPTEGIGVGPGW